MNSGTGQAVTALVDRDAMVELAMDLVRLPSLPPNEASCARLLADYLRARDFEVDLQEVEPGRFNVIARLRGAGGGRSFMFNGHLDIDALPRGWKRDPFTPSLEGDRLYGGGVHNMKAGLATMIGAADAIRRSGAEIKGDLLFTGVVGETQAGVGASYLVAHGPLADTGIVAEPFGTDNVITVHTGWAQAAIHVFGRSRHISDMESGVDAIRKAEKAADALRSMRFTYTPRPDLPKLPRILVGSMMAGQGLDYTLSPNFVSDYATLLVDIRFNPSQSAESVEADLRRTLEAVRSADPEFEYELELPTPKRFNGAYAIEPPLDLPPGASIRDAVVRAYRAVTGRNPATVGAKEPESYAVGDSGHLSKAGVECLIYGPGHYLYNDLPDAPDAYTSVSEMATAAKVMALTALEICNQPARG